MTTFTGEIHPYLADLPIFDAEVESIAESIREVGLLHPITLDTEGRLIGGRHRLAACERAGVEPTFETWDGDVLAFVLHDNAARKHQTIGQRAAEVALSLALAVPRKDGRWQRGTAAIYGDVNSGAGWSVRMSECGLILDQIGRDALVRVARGELDLASTFREAEAKRDAERNLLAEQERIEAEEADARARLAETAPDYLDRYPTARQAWAAWEDDNRREAARIRQEREAAKRKAAEEKRARSDLYTGIAKALGTIGGYGGYSDIGALMADYRADELNPPQAARYLTLDNLTAARRFIDGLIAWKERA